MGCPPPQRWRCLDVHQRGRGDPGSPDLDRQHAGSSSPTERTFLSVRTRPSSSRPSAGTRSRRYGDATIDDLNVAIVGYGLSGRVFHGPLIAATPGMRVSAVVTANPERQAEARRDFPEALVLSQTRDVWDGSGRFDLAVVATASGSHVAVATAAIDAGIPVVVEKPMATTAAAGKSLTDHAAARDVLLVPFLNRRWDSDHLTLRALLAEDRLGTVLRYESRFERWRPTPGTGWRDNREPEVRRRAPPRPRNASDRSGTHPLWAGESRLR